MKIKNPVGLILDWEENGIDVEAEPELAKATAAAILATGLNHSAGRYGRFVHEVYDALAETNDDGDQVLVISEEYLV